MRFLLAIFFLSSLCYGQHWYKGEAIAVGGEEVPIAHLRLQALTRARVNAVEQSGININATSLYVQGESGATVLDIFGSFAQSDMRGIIVEERNVKYTIKNSEQNGEAIFEVDVTLEALIELVNGQPDPTFDVQLKTDKQNYYEGEDLQMTVSSSKDGYLSLFQIRNDSCFILYPHPFIPTTKANLLPAYVPVSIPPKSKPYSWNLDLQGSDGKSMTEFIIAVVTKDEIPIGGKYGNNACFSFHEFNAWLIKIPVDKRSSARTCISILKK